MQNQIVLIMRINKVRKINFMQYVEGRVGVANVKRKFLIYMNMQISQLNELNGNSDTSKART